jgi:lysocardiolipin and lysophospholipid acyltransferase
MSFLEGRRLEPGQKAQADKFSRSRQLPVYKNSLVPRVKGFQATVIRMRDSLDAVYDVTLGYRKGRFPGTFDYGAGGYCKGQVHLHVRRHSIESLPSSEEELAKWCYDRWSEKDELLDFFYAEHRFPGTPVHRPFSKSISSYLPDSIPDISLMPVAFFTNIYYCASDTFKRSE